MRYVVCFERAYRAHPFLAPPTLQAFVPLEQAALLGQAVVEQQAGGNLDPCGLSYVYAHLRARSDQIASYIALYSLYRPAMID